MTAQNQSGAETTEAAARRAKFAASSLAITNSAEKDAALRAIADALVARTPAIVSENNEDIDRARADGTSAALIDRLTLTPDRIAAIAEAVRDVADLPDPVGEVVRGYTLPNGLQVRQLRVPIGVIGMIYEARPNVTVDAGVLAVKSGNAALLRGSSSAFSSNTVLVDVMRSALHASGFPADSIQLVPGTSHESVNELLTARGLVDLIIPRGGVELISFVVMNSTVPVIETGAGNCHVYVDSEADVQMALEILLNAKVQRPSVCNAAETVLVHSAIADQFLPIALPALRHAGVTVHGDDAVQRAGKSADVEVVPATDEDWAAEYYSLDIAAAVVDTFDDALHHIQQWSTGHTEAIVSDSASALNRFADEVDSAVVMLNASTRFTDGAEFGFGAEIGISTQKMHARGPMGLTELTTTKYVVIGDGQVRS